MKKKKDHTGLRNGKMFCFHCGGEYDMNLPQPIEMVVAMGKVFTKQHKDCNPEWKQPMPDQSLGWKEKVLFWQDHGERGASSNVMMKFLTHYTTVDIAHPCDPDDFKRCHYLLEMVPEFRERLDELKIISPVWSNLVDNWDALTILLKEQLAGKNNNMYEIMKTLGC